MQVAPAQARHASVLTTDDLPDKDANSQLKQTYAVGFRSCGRNVVDVLTESLVVYPVAHHIALFHIETSAMEFLHHTKSVRSIQCFHVSSNREFIAVAEIQRTMASSLASAGPVGTTPLTGATASSSSPMKPAASVLTSSGSTHAPEQHVLSIYKTATRSRVRTVTLAHNSNIISCSFSTCNKFIALLEDAPTHAVTYWKVSTAKLVATCKCPSRGARIHIHPNNPNFLSVSGPMLLKYLLWTKTEFRMGNFAPSPLPQVREHEHYVDHIWHREHMVAVTEKGLLLCFRATADYASVDLVLSTRCHHLSSVRMECVTVHAKGFVVGGSAGFFSIYESSDDPKDPFALVRTVSVGDVAFESIAISPSIETIVVCTKSQELLTFAMSSIDTMQEDRVDYCEFTHHGYQLGGIVQIDTCIQRPVIASCGADKTLRVWNYDTKQYEVLHQCLDEPQALGLHPSGFQVIVAFKERLRVYNILVESLRQVRELAIKACRAVRFARGGHLFACASGLTVLVYRSYTFELVHSFSGHIGAVRCLTWSNDDAFLYSAAHDGAVYRWNLVSGGRSDEMQHVVKQCQYTALVVDERDPNVVVVGGSDSKVREITAGDEATVVDLAAGVCVTSMVLARDNKRLYAGTNIGSVLTYAWPLSVNSSRGGGAVVECFVHAEAVTHMCITEDNESLLTCSDDGSICVFKLTAGVSSSEPAPMRASIISTGSTRADAPLQTDGTTIGLRSEWIKQQEKKKALVAFADATLVARDDLDEREAARSELQQRLEQVQADVAFALHRKENEWIDRLRVIKDECDTLVVQERHRYEELEARHQLTNRKHIEELAQRSASHATLTQELENQYERKLANELTRFDALSETLEQTRQQCATLLESQDTQHRGTLHSERSATHARTKEQNDVIKRLHDDLTYNHVKYEEVLHQEESEYEHELARVRVTYEQQLERERQNTAIKQGHVNATQTKLESLQKKIQELKASSHARDVLFATEKAKTAKLEATLAHFEAHVATCAFALVDKDKAIQSLASSNRVLENFRSVLHHRIDNLEVEQAPMRAHMTTLESHIVDMESELVDELKAKAAHDKDAVSKDAKIKTLLHEVQALRQRTLKKEYAVSEMTRELTRLAQLTNLKDMEAAVKDAYRTFVIGEHVHKKPPKAMSLLLASKQDDASASNNKSNTPSPMKRGAGLQPRVSTTPSPSPGKMKQGRNDAFAHQQQQQQGRSGLSAAASDEVLGYDCKQAVDESVKQVEYMSRTIQTLRTSLENAKLKTDRVRRDAVAEGGILIDECNKLRRENKRLQMKIRELEHAMHANGVRSPLATSTSSTRLLHTPESEADMETSVSCPELFTLLQLSPEHDSSLDASAVNTSVTMTTTKLLTPLSKQKQQQQKRKHAGMLPPAGTAALSARHSSSGNNMLSFTRIELEREKRNGNHVAKADDLAQLVERQRKEIQRLQSQVQLFLSPNDDPSEPQCDGSARMKLVNMEHSSSSFSLPLSPSSTAATGSTPITSARHLGGLRPIHVQTSSAPLRSSFVLAPIDQEQQQ